MNSENLRPTDSAWQAIFERYNIYQDITAYENPTKSKEIG